MLVKIIRGTYGYRPNPDEVRVVRKDSHDPAFELDDKEAKRLISLGVAEKCSPVMSPDSKDNLNPPDTGLPEMTAEDIESMEFNNLRKAAKAYGLDTKGSKEDLIMRLKERLISANSNDDPDGAADGDPDGAADGDPDGTADGDAGLPTLEVQEPII
ncbi:MAG: hypothetical protein NC434_14015 [Ruminococcus sp.]|nr:hypothetical protein [Ruminococcus sp.]